MDIPGANEEKMLPMQLIVAIKKEKDKLSIEIRTYWKLSCLTQYWNNLA